MKYRKTYVETPGIYPTHTGDIGAILDSDRGWQAVTSRQDVECLVIHLGGVGKIHSLQDMGEEMIGDGGRTLGSELPMPAHPL